MKRLAFRNSKALIQPLKRLRLLVVAHTAWLAMVCLMGAWWANLILRMATKIGELEASAGVRSSQELDRIHRMLFWESSSFFALLVLSAALLVGLYRRDLARMRGSQALFATFTHELRTPLASIRLQAESLAQNLRAKREESLPTPKAEALVGRLLEDAQRLEAQVERGLELARLEGGGPVFLQPIALQDWVRAFVRRWNQYQWAADRLVLEFLGDTVDGLLVDADPSALEVIFKNLFENALKHEASQKVTVQIRFLPSQVEVNCPSSHYDGMARDLGHLFKKGPGSGGTGVGLYLVRTLMARMGGSVDFQTSSGFAVRLSFRPHPESTREAPARDGVAYV